MREVIGTAVGETGIHSGEVSQSGWSAVSPCDGKTGRFAESCGTLCLSSMSFVLTCGTSSVIGVPAFLLKKFGLRRFVPDLSTQGIDSGT